MRDCQGKVVKVGDRVVVINSKCLGGQELLPGVISRMTKHSVWVLPDRSGHEVQCGKPRTRLAKL